VRFSRGLEKGIPQRAASPHANSEFCIIVKPSGPEISGMSLFDNDNLPYNLLRLDESSDGSLDVTVIKTQGILIANDRLKNRLFSPVFHGLTGGSKLILEL
jgi:hypothetical protein